MINTSSFTGESALPPMPIFLMISTHGVLCPYQMVNKRTGVNHQILVKQMAFNSDGMRKPLASDKPKPGRPKEAASFGLGALPKPFASSPVAGSSGISKCRLINVILHRIYIIQRLV